MSHAARANYASSASGTRSYGMIPPTGMFGSYPTSPAVSRYANYGGALQNDASISSPSPLVSAAGFLGGPNILSTRQQALPYALVPTTYTSPFGTRKYKAALVPLFR